MYIFCFKFETYSTTSAMDNISYINCLKVAILMKHTTYVFMKIKNCTMWHLIRIVLQSGPKVIKLFFSCSTQLSMKFFQLINGKMSTIVGIFTFMSGKNSILCLSEPKEKPNF